MPAPLKTGAGFSLKADPGPSQGPVACCRDLHIFMESNAMDDWKEKKKQLMQTPVFRDMPEDVVGEIAKVVEAKTVPRGTVLFRKGEPGESFWMIETGKVRVFRQDEQGVDLTLSELGPGQSFGERWRSSLESPGRRTWRPWRRAT